MRTPNRQARLSSLDDPDYLVIDLYPEGIAFREVVRTALAVRRVLENAGVESVCEM